ncbi:hypothetical protein FO519_005974 [Halicephalobus sp. NKZ332]|nr:hypothetical protein FO519_005974 [Halicephalobus sp. NKZ332]
MDFYCPPPLHCIQGDCWHLPEKPLKLDHLLDEEPKSFKIEHSEVHREQELLEASTTTPLPDGEVFNFDAFPKPPAGNPLGDPPTESSTLLSTQDTEYYSDEDAKPPSIRPLDDDEDSFLGDFKAIVSNTDSSATSSSPPTRKFRTDLSGDSFSAQKSGGVFKKRREGPKKVKNLSDLIAGHHFEAPRARKPGTRKHHNDNEDTDDDFFEPKNRHPKVSKEGWKPMDESEQPSHHEKFHHHSSHHGNFHQPSQPKDPMRKIFLDYTRENRMRKPVRVEMSGAKQVMRDECSSDRQCGDRYVCCEKRWCDLSRECGLARFCLPDCEITKMTHLSSTGINGMPLIDIVYD